jgi:carbonic anhydrase
MDPTLHRLLGGIRKFQEEVYPQQAEAYRFAASRPQEPHTLIIACADSRVDVETITSAGPGEVFITRNIGNMVPAFGETPGSLGAVIEYAVEALGVKHIAVCGHSDCGAMKALLNPPPAGRLEYVKTWLTHGLASLAVARGLHEKHGGDLLPLLTHHNVLMQVAHLRTHPTVAGALARGAISVSGWVYDIGAGTVDICEDTGDRPFQVVGPRSAK